jgi:hypothetical protein
VPLSVSLTYYSSDFFSRTHNIYRWTPSRIGTRYAILMYSVTFGESSIFDRLNIHTVDEKISKSRERDTG